MLQSIFRRTPRRIRLLQAKLLSRRRQANVPPGKAAKTTALT
jgi:hypothetical protein